MLRRYIEEEIGPPAADSGRERADIRSRIADIDRKAATLLDGLSEETRGFVDAKLREMAAEKRRLESRLETLQPRDGQQVHIDQMLRDGLAALKDLPRLLEVGKIEERKEIVRAFVEGVTVHPDDLRLDLRIRKLPATLPRPGDSTCLMVAGAGFEPATFGL